MTKELLVIKILSTGLRTIDLTKGESLSLKTDYYRNGKRISELDTITFEVEKEWTFNKQQYASGQIKSYELILSNIKTKPVEYDSMGIWDPHESYGDEAEEYFSDYIQEGYREEYVLKDYSGYGFYGEDTDPVYEAVELKECGDRTGAYKTLTKLWQEYPECIDALVHIGNMYFPSTYDGYRAYNCYAAAVDIVERHLPNDFNGLFLWICDENRPYLRALHGLCLFLWKNKDYTEAYTLAKKLLRLCPPDNLGVRGIIDKIENKEEYEL